MLQSAEFVFETGRGVSFHFLHLTFQEYLAAQHLVKQPPNEQVEVFQSNTSVHFDMIRRFFFGIYICETTMETKDLDFRLVKFDSPMLRRAYLCTTVSRCHCAFEARNIVVTDRVIYYLKDHFGSPRTAHDCAAVLYVISSIQECSSLKINFRNCGVRENQIRTLTDVLASKCGKLQVKTLDLNGNKLTDKCVSDLLHRASAAFQSPWGLYLGGNRIGAESINSIATLAKSYSSELSYLNLSHNPLGVSDLQLLADTVLSHLFNLEELYLQGSLTSDADTNAALLTTIVEALLHHCPNLKELGLSQNNLGVPGASALATVVSNSSAHIRHYKTG